MGAYGSAVVGLAFLVAAPSAIAAVTTAAFASDATPDATSVVTAFGQRHDGVSDGTDRVWLPGAGDVAVTGDISDLTVTTSGGSSGRDATFRLTAPPGEALAPGTYTDARLPPSRDGAAAGLAGLDVQIEEREGGMVGCAAIIGRFTILDISPDLSRVHVLYEQRCQGYDGGLFGEIDIGRPAGAGPFVGAREVRWPAQYTGVATEAVAVTVAGDADGASRIASVGVRGRDAEDFAVLNTDCRELGPSGTCTVYVGFRPGASGERTAQLVVADDTSARSTVRLTGRGDPARTSWSMDSDEGDFVGQGRRYRFAATDSRIDATGDAQSLDIRVESNRGTFDARFSAAPGERMRRGDVYTVAPPAVAHGEGPELDVGGSGRGCNSEVGRFVVDRLVERNGRIAQVAIRFEQHCEGHPAALHGAIQWRVTPRPAAPAETRPGPVTHTRVARRTDERIVLRWTDPLDPGWRRTLVRVLPGRRAPATPNEGVALYSGRAGRTTVSVPARRQLRIALFTQDRDGDFGPRSVLTVAPDA